MPSDYGDGGSFPEIHVAQYPLDMGREGKSEAKKGTIAMQVRSFTLTLLNLTSIVYDEVIINEIIHFLI